MARPATTTVVVPIRSTMRGPTMLATAIEMATGSNRTPVSNAL